MNRAAAAFCPEYPYVFGWGNNALRAKYKGKRCRVLTRGRKNSIAIQFEDGHTMVTSGHAIRVVK